MKQAIQAENEVLKEALSQLLGREPTEIDYKQVTRFFTLGNMFQYSLTYNGVSFGSVDKSITINKYSVTFTPNVQRIIREIQL